MRARRNNSAERRGRVGVASSSGGKGQHPHLHMASESVPASTPRRQPQHHKTADPVVSSIDHRLINQKAQEEFRKRYGSIG